MKPVVLACIALARSPPRPRRDRLRQHHQQGRRRRQAGSPRRNRDFTDEEEVALGDGLAPGFLGAAPLDPDANLQRYVNRVGKWLRPALRAVPTCRGASA